MLNVTGRLVGLMKTRRRVIIVERVVGSRWHLPIVPLYLFANAEKEFGWVRRAPTFPCQLFLGGKSRFLTFRTFVSHFLAHSL